MDRKKSIDPQGIQPKRPVVFGEVLFDCFEGKDVLGGAPLNVAWHLQALGWNPLLLSRIGMDDFGREVVTRLQDWGMDTTGIQRDMRYPTGRVEVKMVDDSHTFHILEKQAYDFIAPETALHETNLQQASILYHGSLAMRGESHQTFLRLSEEVDAPIFLDINLRDPWWTRESALEMVRRANLLKLNDEEMKLLKPSSRNAVSTEQALKEACEDWHLDALWLTLGSEGAAYCSANGEYFQVEPANHDMEIIDTVGAGDAFSAAILGGFLKGSPPRDTATCAALLATRICGRRGATVTDPGLYKGLEAVKCN